MDYDTRSYELAKYFLSDEPNATEHDAEVLAQHIQTTIEDWLIYDFTDRHRQPIDDDMVF